MFQETLNESGEEVETNSIDLEQERVASPPPLLFPISTLRTRGACQSLRPLHRSIKNKFLEILTTSFKPVPTLQEYYFCSPNIERLLSAQVHPLIILKSYLFNRMGNEPLTDFKIMIKLRACSKIFFIVTEKTQFYGFQDNINFYVFDLDTL